MRFRRMNMLTQSGWISKHNLIIFMSTSRLSKVKVPRDAFPHDVLNVLGSHTSHRWFAYKLDSIRGSDNLVFISVLNYIILLVAISP